MKLVLLVLLLASTMARAALPGVVELESTPEAISDAELSVLLDKRIADADVFAIGESVHGSSGFLRVQARLIRYLVTQHRFRLIVWENPTLRSLELAAWARSCRQAKSPTPIDVLYMPTTTDHALFDWICDFNRANPGDPIVFRGMDIWDRPWAHYARIRALGARLGIAPELLKTIAATCPAYRSSSWDDIEGLFAALGRDGRFLPEKLFAQCRSALTALGDASRRAGLEKSRNNDASANDAFELALSASTLFGWLGFYDLQWIDDIRSWNERDRAQGRNLMLLMDMHNARRAILAAHTSHVSHNRSPTDWWGYGDLKSGVHFFTAMTGKRVFNIALTAYRASGTQGEWSYPIAKSSMDKKLRDAGHVLAFFPADAAFLAEHAKWWMQNGNFPGPYESGIEIRPADHFDAYVFFERSLLDKALPQRPMWQP